MKVGSTHMERYPRIERAGDGLFEGEEAVAHLIERIVGPWAFGSTNRRHGRTLEVPEGSSVQDHCIATFLAALMISG